MSSHRGYGIPAPDAVASFGAMRQAQRTGPPPVKRAESPPVIKLKSPREIGLMREAGRVVAKALDQVRRMARPGRDHRRDGRGRGRDLSRTRRDRRCFWATPARSRESRRSPR